MEATRRKQAETIFGLILWILQVCAVFGLAVGKFTEALAGYEMVTIGLLSAVIGVVQGWVTSIRARKLLLKGAPPAGPVMFLLAVFALFSMMAMSACSLPAKGGTSITLFPAPALTVDKDRGTLDARLLPDPADPDLGVVEVRYKSKVGELPDIAFSVNKPAPDEVVARAGIRFVARPLATAEK